MSHFAEMKVNALVKNENDLIASLEACFGKGNVQVHDKAVPLTGFDAAAKMKGHIVIKKSAVQKAFGHAWNDIGFERQEDGSYALHYDPADWKADSRNKVMVDYTERVSTRKLKAQGYVVKREVQKDGTVKLIGSKY